MNDRDLKDILKRLQDNEIDAERAFTDITGKGFEDLGFAKPDHIRSRRKGFSEVIYSPGKTNAQLYGIIKSLIDAGETNILVTRAGKDVFESIKPKFEEGVLTYFETARIILVNKKNVCFNSGYAIVACAGTTDMPVAEEAAVTAETLGCSVKRIYDVGVAGLHRLLAYEEDIAGASVIIAVAGMEGALPSVIGGLAQCPVLAVPTSVGYGASFGGVAALLGMLNSCSSGVAVLNIDNGFGAGYFAATLLRTIERKTDAKTSF